MEEIKLDIEAGENYVAPALYYFGGKYQSDNPEIVGTVLQITEANGFKIGEVTEYGRIDYFFRSDEDARIKVMYVRNHGESSGWDYLVDVRQRS